MTQVNLINYPRRATNVLNSSALFNYTLLWQCASSVDAPRGRRYW